jgi:coenzyme F420-reducing hydrogenase delta subunit
MCSGRVDLEHILRAFSKGADAVFIGGCRLDECNYITHGNYDALGNVLMFKKIMEHIGLNPDRLRIEFMSSGDGLILTAVINEFCNQAKEFGPLGKKEGVDGKILKFKLEAVSRLIPYIKLVERERLRVPHKSEETYRDFFSSDKFNRLFKELILDKLAVSQIMLLLREQPLSTGEMSEKLGLNPSEISKHMNTSTRHGMVRFDKSQKRYALR